MSEVVNHIEEVKCALKGFEGRSRATSLGYKLIVLKQGTEQKQ